MTRYWIFAILLLFAGCASIAPHTESKGKPMLEEGIKNYEDGNYREAIAKLQGALDAGLSDAAERVRAHKYLAFAFCVSSRETLCREEFSKILEIDPKFELAPAEAGHPIWGNVFRSVKRNLK